MHSLRTVALGATLVFGLAAAAGAQSTQGAERGSDRAGEQGRKGGRMRGPGRALLRGIELSTAQREQLRAIQQRYRPQHDSLRTRLRDARRAEQRPDSATRAAWRTQMQTLMTRQHSEIRAVLTPDQQKTFDANVVRMKERAADRGRGGHHGR